MFMRVDLESLAELQRVDFRPMLKYFVHSLVKCFGSLPWNSVFVGQVSFK